MEEKLRWLDITCPACGRRLNSWDVRCSKALGYLKYQICESCLCAEYDRDVESFRSTMETFFGMRPCRGL